MKPWLKFCWQGTRFCVSCLTSFCVWTLWLALSVLLVFQIYITSSRELALPDFVLRSFEARLAAAGAKLEFGRASFDPLGHVLIEQVSIRLPAFAEPIATAESVYITLDLWALAVGRFEPRALQVSGADLQVAAMLSPTGRAEPIMRDLHFTLIPGSNGLEFPQLSGRLSTLRINAHGGLQTTMLRRGSGAPQPIPELLARNYPAICRQLIALNERLAGLDSPSVNLELTPSETRGAIVSVEVLASGLKLAAPLSLDATRLRAVTQLPLLGDAPYTGVFKVTAGSVRQASGFAATGVHALISGRLASDFRQFDFLQADVTAATVSGAAITGSPFAVRAVGPLPNVEAELTTQILGEPLDLHGTMDISAHSANFRATGRFAPGLLIPLGEKLGRDIRRFINFESAPAFDLDVAFAHDWKFTSLAGRIAGDDALAYQVPMNAFSGHIEFDGQRFRATEAVAFIGDNFARGSFEQEFASREFRFLLTGRLNPPAIDGWFHEWWPNFWTHFDFTNGAPVADVDVHGWWGQGLNTTVFVFADCAQPVIRGVSLDHAITRLFIRPHYYDVLELFATRGGGSATGSFTRRLAPEDYSLEGMTFDFDSTLELPAAVGLVGPEVSATFQPFVFSTPPSVKVHGQIDGPAAPRGEHRRIQVEGYSAGAFSFHDFPLQHLEFVADLNDDELSISRLQAGFADGVAAGDIRLSGPDANRRLEFTLSLRDASLRQATVALDTFSARRQGVPPSTSGEFGGSQVRLALDVSAKGTADDPYSFTGNGRADLWGQGLGRIRLLGLLSELLNFTALRFDTLHADFKLQHDSLVFPRVNLSGPDAAVTAHGTYLLARKELDFNARVFPFQESTFILKSVMGLMLSPLSGVLEVKLTGQLGKPQWAFVIGPTNFLRSILASPAKEPAVPPRTSVVPLVPIP